MKKWLWIIIPVILLLIGYTWFKGKYNHIVQLDEKVTAQWAEVENNYERKYKLIPNLVSVAKNYAEFEKDVLIGVTEARANATSIKIDPSNITPQQLQQFEAAQGQLNGALSRLLATFERYPDLKANRQFENIQAELSGSENRIAVARKRFTEGVQEFNSYIRKFPNNLIAGMFDFERKPQFEASAEAKDNNVDVDQMFE